MKKRLGLALLAVLLIIGVWTLPSPAQVPPKDIKACQKECKRTYKECVRAGEVSEPLCEAAFAFCEECCTGGC